MASGTTKPSPERAAATMLAATHSGTAQAPTSLSGVATAKITLPKARKIEFQAALFSTPTGFLNWRLSTDDEDDDTTLANAEQFMGFGGVKELHLDPATQYYLYVFLTDATGASATGGASDYVNIYVENDRGV